MFILNTTMAIKFAWNIIQTFMRESTKKKLSLTNKSTDPDLFNFAHESQIGIHYKNHNLFIFRGEIWRNSTKYRSILATDNAIK